MAYSDISFFYGFWQLAVCLFAFLGLLAIWYHLGRKQKDYGQIWLALSILCWSATGGVELYFTTRDLSEVANSNLLEVWKSILSLLNSLFILIALSWFKYLPKILEKVIKSKTWIVIIGLPFVFSLLPTLSKLFTNNQHSIISELDVYYSTLTLILLGMVLWESFSQRRLKLLAYLSILCIMITFLAQVYKLTNSEVNQLLLSAIFKTCLIMIFFALALSWVKDISETLSVIKNQLSLKIGKRKLDDGKWEHIAMVGGIFNIKNKETHISKSNFALLEKFITQRKNGSDGWLEIKPKNDSRDGKIYDINDYNEVKRLIHTLLDGLFGKGLWSKDQHEKPLKEALFEISKNRDRKIRLSVANEMLEVETT